MRYFCVAVLVAALSASLANAAEPVMVFEGDGLTIVVTSVSEDEMTLSGELVRGNDRWPFTGRSTGDGEISTVKGTFRVGNQSFPFTATHTESTGTIKFVTDGAVYNLREKGPAAAPAPAPAKPDPKGPADNRTPVQMPETVGFTTAEFRDIHMGNVVAMTMLVPEGFRTEGHIEWSDGKTPYPQTRIKVIGPDKSQIAFFPFMSFLYWEATESARQLNAQFGGGVPDRQGTPPPANLGQWMADLARQGGEVTNVRLISDERDAQAEAAYAALQRQMPHNPNGPPPATEIHIVKLAYELDGVPFIEETSVSYTKLPPSHTQHMVSYMWTLYVNSSVRAPSAKFAQVRPILYASASSLQPVPRWFTQSQWLIMQHTRNNHEIGMKDIAERAAHYDKLREEDMKAWRKAQEISDKQQDARINMIYEVSNFAGPNGSVKKLPNGFKHYYSNGKGGFLMSNSAEPPKGGEWKPVEPIDK